MAVNIKQFFSKTTNIVLFLAVIALLAGGAYLLYLQLNPVVTAVIQTDRTTKITVQCFTCGENDIMKAPYVERMLEPGTHNIEIHANGVPRRVRILVSSGKPIFLHELSVKQITKKDLLPGAAATETPIGPTGKSEAVPMETMPISLTGGSVIDIHIAKAIHGC